MKPAVILLSGGLDSDSAIWVLVVNPAAAAGVKDPTRYQRPGSSDDRGMT